MVGKTEFTLTKNSNDKVEIQKGRVWDLSQSTCAFAVQQVDDADLSKGGNKVQSWFKFLAKGAGKVINNVSYAFWLGLYSDMRHEGTGSAHAFTANVELVKNTGYAEAGAFQGVVTNYGIDGAYMSLFEGICDDSGKDTRMYASALRIIRKKGGKETSAHILLSAEGPAECDYMMTCNPDPNASNVWRVGLDLSRGVFTTGYGVLMPNNGWLAWRANDGSPRWIFAVNHFDDTILSAVKPTSKVRITDGSFYDKLTVDADRLNGVLIQVNGSMRRVHTGAPDSGGTGKRMLVVDN